LFSQQGVHPHPPLQLLDLSQQRRDHRIPLRQGSQQLLAAELRGIGHALKLRTSQHSSHDHQNRRVYLKSDTGNGPEWIHAVLEFMQGTGLTRFSPVRPQHWVIASFEHHTSPHGLPRSHIYNIVLPSMTTAA
jgi:hypothetical protein